MLKRLDETGLSARATVLERTTGELLVTWLTPLLREYETIEQLEAAGAQWVYGDNPDATRALIKARDEDLGERVCALWPFEAFAVELAVDDFADHFEELWYPASDDVWLLSLHHRRFVVLSHDELLLYGDLGGPTALARPRAARPLVTRGEAVGRAPRARLRRSCEAGILADHFLDADARGKPGSRDVADRLARLLAGARPGRAAGSASSPRRATSAGRAAARSATWCWRPSSRRSWPRLRRTPGSSSRATRAPTGVLGYWVRKLADGGLVAALTATSPPRLAHPDGGPPLTGTSPLAIAIPSSDGDPVVADVSMAKATHGDVLIGKAPPEDLVPFGGDQAHKAFALAVGLQLLVDALAGDGLGAVLLVARPEADPVPAFRNLAGRRAPPRRPLTPPCVPRAQGLPCSAGRSCPVREGCESLCA